MIRVKLIKAGVQNLKEFGYPHVDVENILTDQIYAGFFISMLKENLGHSKAIDTEINKLLAEIDKQSVDEKKESK